MSTQRPYLSTAKVFSTSFQSQAEVWSAHRVWPAMYGIQLVRRAVLFDESLPQVSVD
jgi:hypothetical protein